MSEFPTLVLPNYQVKKKYKYLPGRFLSFLLLLLLGGHFAKSAAESWGGVGPFTGKMNGRSVGLMEKLFTNLTTFDSAQSADAFWQIQLNGNVGNFFLKRKFWEIRIGVTTERLHSGGCAHIGEKKKTPTFNEACHLWTGNKRRAQEAFCRRPHTEVGDSAGGAATVGQ